MMAQQLVLYPHNTVSSINANGYTITNSPPTPSNNFPSTTGKGSLLGTATGWGEITSKGAVSAWQALGAIGAPTGKGFWFDTNVLDNCFLLAGSWYEVVRLSTSVADNPTGETVTADLFFRWYLWRVANSTYNSIVGLSTLGVTIGAFADFSSQYAQTNQATFLHAGDRLYCDLWANVHTNANGDANLQLRWNSIATTAASSVDNYFSTPGYLPSNLEAVQGQALPPTAITLREL